VKVIVSDEALASLATAIPQYLEGANKRPTHAAEQSAAVN
jgi:hypothetical protein